MILRRFQTQNSECLILNCRLRMKKLYLVSTLQLLPFTTSRQQYWSWIFYGSTSIRYLVLWWKNLFIKWAVSTIKYIRDTCPLPPFVCAGAGVSRDIANIADTVYIHHKCVPSCLSHSPITAAGLWSVETLRLRLFLKTSQSSACQDLWRLTNNHHLGLKIMQWRKWYHGIIHLH